jgi:hypothetical protein
VVNRIFKDESCDINLHHRLRSWPILMPILPNALVARLLLWVITALGVKVTTFFLERRISKETMKGNVDTNKTVQVVLALQETIFGLSKWELLL